MSEYKMVHDILQRIDDDLIDEAVNAKKNHSPIRKFATSVAAILICVFFSVGVVTAISPSFREGMIEQFQSKFPKVKEENMYHCQVTYPAKEDSQEIALTEEEAEKVLDIIRNSESEVISLENGNMEYAKKEGISISLTILDDQYEFTYILVVAEENILTYSIEKQSLESNNVTEKHYVIYSEELYNLVMEKTVGGEQYEE